MANFTKIITMTDTQDAEGDESISIKELDEIFLEEVSKDTEDENTQCNEITENTLVSSNQINLGVEVVDSDTEIKNPFDADFDRCPKCESNNINWGEPDSEGVLIYRLHQCNNCGTRWEEKYELTRVEITEGNTEKIEGNMQ